MYLILTASKDTYITNKIVDNKFRATDANIGQAGTLDLFKLYDESTISGETNPIELSRALIKFNYDKINDLTGSIIDITNNSFKCELVLKDVMGGQATPTNFNLILFPLSKSFDEGAGRDISSFADLDRSNFITASYSNGSVDPWNKTGANRQGLLKSDDIDIISSGNIGSGVEDLWVEQNFAKGSEDLKMDITKIVSASLKGDIPNYGFRLSFSGSEETDTKTRFVKRFASRHVLKKSLVPQIHVYFDDSLQDHHRSFFFDVSGSLFLKNYHRGRESNVVSGSSITKIGGQNCMLQTIRTGSYVQYITASQHTGSTTSAGLPGVYSASFAIPSNDSTVVDFGTTLSQMVSRTGSITFEEYWSDFTGLVGYYTGSLTVDRPTTTGFNYVSNEPSLTVTNMQSTYRYTDVVRFRVYGSNLLEEYKKAVKTPLKRPAVVFDEAYYSIIDLKTGDVIVPFETKSNGTRMSSDSEGYFFNFRMNNLFSGASYKIHFLVKDRGSEFKITDSKSSFTLKD